MKYFQSSKQITHFCFINVCTLIQGIHRLESLIFQGTLTFLQLNRGNRQLVNRYRLFSLEYRLYLTYIRSEIALFAEQIDKQFVRYANLEIVIRSQQINSHDIWNVDHWPSPHTSFTSTKRCLWPVVTFEPFNSLRALSTSVFHRVKSLYPISLQSIRGSTIWRLVTGGSRYNKNDMIDRGLMSPRFSNNQIGNSYRFSVESLYWKFRYSKFRFLHPDFLSR